MRWKWKLERIGHDHGVSPFWGPGKSLRTLRCRDYLVRLRLQGIGGLGWTASGQFSRLAINAIRRTIVRHAKRGRCPQSMAQPFLGSPDCHLWTGELGGSQGFCGSSSGCVRVYNSNEQLPYKGFCVGDG